MKMIKKFTLEVGIVKAVLAGLVIASSVSAEPGVTLVPKGGAAPVICAAVDDPVLARAAGTWQAFFKERGVEAVIVKSAGAPVMPDKGAVLVFETEADCPVAKEAGVNLAALKAATSPEAHVISVREWKGRALVLVVGKTATGADAGSAFLLSKVVCEVGGEGAAWTVTCAPLELCRVPFFRGREATLCPTGRIGGATSKENYENWDKVRLEKYPAYLKACGFNSVQLMELLTYNAATKVWKGGYRGGAQGKSAEEIQQVLFTLADAAHAQGMTVSQYIWGSPADGNQWADPKTRPAREEFYSELARRYGAKVDHIITHWKDEGNEGGHETPLTATMFIWKEYRKHNPKVQVTCDAWFNPGIYKGIDDETYASKDVAIAIERWYTPKWAEQIAKSGRKIGVWGWYLSDFEMTFGSHLYTRTLDKYFSALPPRAGELVDWLSMELCFHGMPSELNLYVTGRKMWEPQTPLADLVRDYCAAVYGPVNAEIMRQVYATVEEGQKEVRYGMVESDRYPAVVGTPAFKVKVDAALAALEKVVLPVGWKPNFAVVGSPQGDIDSLRASLKQFILAPIKAGSVSDKTGRLTQVFSDKRNSQFVVEDDRIVVETSLGPVTNDLAQLVSSKAVGAGRQFMYRTGHFDLSVNYQVHDEDVERTWSLSHREKSAFRVVSVTESLRFTEPFDRIDLHTDGSALGTPINLFLRGKKASVAIGVTYPWVTLAGDDNRGARLSYEIEESVASNGTFTSETTFIVPCAYEEVLVGKDKPLKRISNKTPEPMDAGELWAMQRYVAGKVTESSLPVNGYFLWLNGWWANLVKAPGLTWAEMLPGTGVDDAMTAEVWWGHGIHPGCGDALKAIKPGDPLALPSNTVAQIGVLKEKGIHLGSFCSPANPYFGDAMPGWSSLRQDGKPQTYIGKNVCNCWANPAYVSAFMTLQAQAIKDSGGRFWAWDGRTLSFGEWDQGDAGDRYKTVPCFAEGHGHMPGKQFFQEYRNLRGLITDVRRQFPKLCFQTYWGLKRGMPWIASGLNAVEGYYEAESSFDQRLQAWYNQQYRYLPAYMNWSHLESPDPKEFEVSLISAISISTHSQLGKCWPGFAGEPRAENVATLAKWKAFADTNRRYLSVKRDLFGTPGSQWLDGSAHCIKDRGLLFLFLNGKRPENTLAAIPLTHWIGLTDGARFLVTRVHPGPAQRIGVFEHDLDLVLAVDSPAEVYTIEPTDEPSGMVTPLPAVVTLTPAFCKGDILQVPAPTKPSSKNGRAP